LQCGDPHFGFARIRCKECGAEYLRASSCKCRGFCPSCSKRKSLDLAIFLEEELFRPVPHRHWVWSVPKMFRLHFLHHRKLLPKLCGCAWDALTMFPHEALDRRDVFPGGILVPQTFGGMANWNPHVHALITGACRDRKGNCYAMPEIGKTDIKGIDKLFTNLVFKMLLAEGMISAELVENMRSWENSISGISRESQILSHAGFSVHCGTPIQTDETDSRKTLSEYISRAPFSLERMSFNEASDTVLYRGEHFHLTLARNFDVTDPLERIARITSHNQRRAQSRSFTMERRVRHGEEESVARAFYRKQQPKRNLPLPEISALHSCTAEDRCGLHFSRKPGMLMFSNARHAAVVSKSRPPTEPLGWFANPAQTTLHSRMMCRR
jgi:hypothetical protein